MASIDEHRALGTSRGRPEGGPSQAKADHVVDAPTMAAAGTAERPRPGADVNAATSAAIARAGRDEPCADLEGMLVGGRYEVSRRLGGGGMGSVYLARHVTIEKSVAIKILAQDLAAERVALQRFLREAKMASLIRHPNIVDIHDFGDLPDGRPYFVMDFLDGEDLAVTLDREGPFGWPRAREITKQILSALSSAHAKDVIHRDMKPANCFRVTDAGQEDFIKILDFGIAKSVGAEGDGGLTGEGTLLGTANYMAPEQIMGKTVDARTDIYAVGMILFRMLSGSIPFQDEGQITMLTKRVTTDPPNLVDVSGGLDVDPRVDALVARALAREPGARFQTAREMLGAIEELTTGGSRTVTGANEVIHSESSMDTLAANSSQARAIRARVGASTSEAGSTAEVPAAVAPGPRRRLALPILALALLGVVAWLGLERLGTEQPDNSSVVASPSPAPTPELPAPEPEPSPEPEPEPDLSPPPDLGPPVGVEPAPSVDPNSEPRDGKTKRKKSGKKKKATDPKPTTHTSPSPTDDGPRESLGRADIRAALGPSIAKASKCSGAIPGMRISARLRINADGSVASVELPDQRVAPGLSSCVTRSLQAATFPKLKAAKTIKHEFRL